MSADALRDLICHATSWPDDDQQELADYARVFEARRTGLYRVNDPERLAISEGLGQADAGDFVSEATLDGADKRDGRRASLCS